MGGRGKFLVAGLLIVAAVVYLIVSSTGSTARYFLTVEELQELGAETGDRSVTVSGAVLGNTIDYDASVPRVTFTIVQVTSDPREVERAGGLAAVLEAAVSDADAPRLEVVYEDVKPDLLQHETQAIVRGQMGPDGRFYADEVLLKCPTKYEEGVPEQAGES
ncbi:MAG: cytochrome c maturation protein CcmE [Anaerolineae bacterium]|jgi:cytochrome c-type biogenesis protein CcmE